MKVLHIDTGKTWRGGQAQIFNLIGHLPGNIESHILAPAGSELINRIKGHLPGGRIHIHPLRGEWDLSAARRVKKLSGKYSFDIIHAHSSHALGIAWVAGISSKLPPVIETRRLETPVTGNFLSRLKYSRALLHVANSETVREALIESGISPEAIKVVPSGIDLQRIDSAAAGNHILKKYNINPENIIIGNVGALTEQKDHKTLIRAAEKVIKRKEGVEFVIAGEGRLRRSLEKLSSELGIKDHIHLIGFVDNIYSLFKTFNIYVNSSLYEGLCGTILQAMACRVPVLSSDVKGSRQILNHGQNCRVVAKKDPGALGGEIISLLEGRYNIKEMTGRALKTAEKYDYPALALKMAKIYARIARQ